MTLDVDGTWMSTDKGCHMENAQALFATSGEGQVADVMRTRRECYGYDALRLEQNAKFVEMNELPYW